MNGIIYMGFCALSCVAATTVSGFAFGVLVAYAALQFLALVLNLLGVLD